jgi:hypothetical protein
LVWFLVFGASLELGAWNLELHRSSGDENVRAVLDRGAGRFRLDAAIDFDAEPAAVGIAPLLRAPNFFHHLRPERLAAETGMHGHDEKQIDRPEIRHDRFERRRGIQG